MRIVAVDATRTGVVMTREERGGVLHAKLRAVPGAHWSGTMLVIPTDAVESLLADLRGAGVPNVPAEAVPDGAAVTDVRGLRAASEVLRTEAARLLEAADRIDAVLAGASVGRRS